MLEFTLTEVYKSTFHTKTRKVHILKSLTLQTSYGKVIVCDSWIEPIESPRIDYLDPENSIGDPHLEENFSTRTAKDEKLGPEPCVEIRGTDFYFEITGLNAEEVAEKGLENLIAFLIKTRDEGGS